MLRNRQREISIALAIVAIGAILAGFAPTFFSFANVRDLLLAHVPVLIVAIGAILAGFAPTFFICANGRDLLLANVPVLIVAIGMTLIVITAQIDISVGSQFAICSVAAGAFVVAGLHIFP